LRATGELPDRAVLRRAEVRDRRPDDSFRGDGISLAADASGRERVLQHIQQSRILQ
jgi:hypothetical protein